MKQSADRRRRNHRCRQPAVEGHQRSLADAKGIEQQENGEAEVADPSFGEGRPENAAAAKLERAGEPPGHTQGEQQKGDRRRNEDAQVGAPSPTRFLGAVVCHQRIRREREHLVEQKQGKPVAREGNAERGKDR